MIASPKFQLGCLLISNGSRLLFSVKLITRLLTNLGDILLLRRLKLTLTRVSAACSLELLAWSCCQEYAVLIRVRILVIFLIEHYSNSPWLLEALAVVLSADATCHGSVLKASSWIKNILRLILIHSRLYVYPLHHSSSSLGLRHILTLWLTSSTLVL
jgi:hypothetical protein